MREISQGFPNKENGTRDEGVLDNFLHGLLKNKDVYDENVKV